MSEYEHKDVCLYIIDRLFDTLTDIIIENEFPEEDLIPSQQAIAEAVVKEGMMVHDLLVDDSLFVYCDESYFDNVDNDDWTIYPSAPEGHTIVMSFVQSSGAAIVLNKEDNILLIGAIVHNFGDRMTIWPFVKEGSAEAVGEFLPCVDIYDTEEDVEETSRVAVADGSAIIVHDPAVVSDEEFRQVMRAISVIAPAIKPFPPAIALPGFGDLTPGEYELAAGIPEDDDQANWLLSEIEMYAGDITSVRIDTGEQILLCREDGKLAWQAGARDRLYEYLWDTQSAGIILRSSTNGHTQIRGYFWHNDDEDTAWNKLSPEAVRDSYSYDADTGAALLVDDTVEYC